MGLFARLITVVKAQLNSWIGSAENPARIIEQSLADMREQFTRAKRDVASAIADEKKLQAELARETKQASEWENRAMLAVRENRDDLASLALERQSEHDERVRQLSQACARQQEGSAALKKSLQSMSDRIEELSRKKSMLSARQHSAEAQQRIHGTLATIDAGPALETFERMEQKVADMEYRADAVAELNEEVSGSSLERQFRSLEKAAPDQRLRDLKAKMGVPSQP